MKSTHSIILRLFLIPFIFACHKETGVPGQIVEIYPLKAYQLEQGQCKVIPSSAVMADTVLVADNEIINYRRSDHSFLFKPTGVERIKRFDNTPFAVAVDKTIIYIGFLKPSYSSSTCLESITMDYVYTQDRVLLRLGYPGPGGSIDDQRNNSTLIATLKKQGKLR